MPFGRVADVILLCTAIVAGTAALPRDHVKFPKECLVFVDKTEEEVKLFVGHWDELLFGPDPSVSIHARVKDVFQSAILAGVDRERAAVAHHDPDLRKRFITALESRFRDSTDTYCVASTDYGPERMLAEALNDVPGVREAIPILPWKVHVASNVWYECDDELKQTVYRDTNVGTRGGRVTKSLKRVLSTDQELIRKCTTWVTDWWWNTCQEDVDLEKYRECTQQCSASVYGTKRTA